MTQSVYESPQRRFSFAYTTIARLREEGLTTAQLSDARAIERIKLAGKIVNRVTSQWFVPIEGTERISVSPDSSIAWHPSLIPIIEVRSLKLADFSGALTTYTASRYRIDDRLIYLSEPRWGTSVEDKIARLEYGDRRAMFPAGRGHIVVDGTFGWIENRPWSDDPTSRKVTTTTAAEVSAGDTTIELTSVANIRARDILILRNGDAPSTFGTRAIVSSVVDSPASVTVDSIEMVPGATLPAGSNVITYGQVPEDVEMATVYIVAMLRYGIATSNAQQSSVQGRMLSEQTDAYAYRLESTGIRSMSDNSTGSLEADRLLSQFHPPPAAFAV